MNPTNSVSQPTDHEPARSRATAFWDAVEAACGWRLLDETNLPRLGRRARLVIGVGLIVGGALSVAYNLWGGGS